MSGAALEVELKLWAADDGPLDRLGMVADLGPARLGPPRRLSETDRYLDTVDRRLAAARWACRLRTRGEVTVTSLKGPAEHGPADVVHRRPEIEGREAERLAAELAGGLPLVEVVTLEQDRIVRQVVAGEVTIGSLWLDRCRVVPERGGRPIGKLRVVELELARPETADGAAHAVDAATDATVAALLEVPGLRPDPDSKLEHALAMLGERV